MMSYCSKCKAYFKCEEIVHPGTMVKFRTSDKGYIQLAIRSGQYKKLNVMAIKEGELIKFDPLNEEIEINLVDNWDERESLETIGYYAMFELVNGFKKAIYWSKKQMIEHAKKYSQGYKKDLEKGTAWTFWSKDFDGMAYKTMLRQLISKWGIMSIDMQNAYTGDMAVINDDGSKNYVDNDIEEPVMDIQSIPVTEPEQPAEAQTDDISGALFG